MSEALRNKYGDLSDERLAEVAHDLYLLRLGIGRAIIDMIAAKEMDSARAIGLRERFKIGKKRR